MRVRALPGISLACLVAGACSLAHLTDGVGGGSAGGSGPGACVSASDCLTEEASCIAPSCVNGQCGVEYRPEGTVVAFQTTGDCKEIRCAAAGVLETVAIDDDPFDDAAQCTIDGCKAGIATHDAAPASMACQEGGGMHCDGRGACVACSVDAECPSGGHCQLHKCVLAKCVNGVKDVDIGETDVDCGGPCGGCADQEGCVAAADCLSGFCDGTMCAPCTGTSDCPADTFCQSTTKTCKPKKPAGQICYGDVQCTGDACVDGFCCESACEGICEGCSSALTGAANGTCAPIPGGTDPDGECTPGNCNGKGVCRCVDGVKDGVETDVDCGGNVCGVECGSGKKCLIGSDCKSGHCQCAGQNCTCS